MNLVFLDQVLLGLVTELDLLLGGLVWRSVNDLKDSFFYFPY